LKPSAVRPDSRERETLEPRFFEAFDVVFDVGVSAHVGIQLDRREVGVVGVVTPVAVEGAREQGSLRTRMETFSSHDQSSPRRPISEVNEAGEFRDMGTFSDVAVGAQRWLPVFVAVGPERLDLLDCRLDPSVCAGHDPL
jgi:hypothetical protein